MPILTIEGRTETPVKYPPENPGRFHIHTTDFKPSDDNEKVREIIRRGIHEKIDRLLITGGDWLSEPGVYLLRDSDSLQVLHPKGDGTLDWRYLHEKGIGKRPLEDLAGTVRKALVNRESLGDWVRQAATHYLDPRIEIRGRYNAGMTVVRAQYEYIRNGHTLVSSYMDRKTPQQHARSI